MSPLQKHMVEIDSPYASRIYGYARLFSESLLFFTFQNVPVRKIDEVLTKFKEILGKISDEEKLDMQRMQSIIDKKNMESLSALENAPHYFLSELLRNDAVHGTNESNVSILCKKFL